MYVTKDFSFMMLPILLFFQEPGYCNSIAMLTTNLLVSGGQVRRVFYYINEGTCSYLVNKEIHSNFRVYL